MHEGKIVSLLNAKHNISLKFCKIELNDTFIWCAKFLKTIDTSSTKNVSHEFCGFLPWLKTESSE